jgi:glycosyltransferase involved in cell wall biosynthesis
MVAADVAGETSGVKLTFMLARISGTIRFFGGIVRDLAGTLRARWRSFHQRAVLGEEVASVGVDIYPFFECMTGIGWYEWNLLRALDRRDDGLCYNLYARTFRAPDEPEPPIMPGERKMRLRVHQIPAGFLLPAGPTLAALRLVVEPLLRTLDGNHVLFAPNFFPHRDQWPFGRAHVATVHDLAFLAMPETVSPPTVTALNRHLPATLFHADRLIAVSDATAGELKGRLGVGERKIHTIHEGVDPRFADRAGADLPSEIPERYLLFVSTLEPRKNVEGILQAFSLLKQWGYRGDLVLVGRWGWRTERIQAELEDSPVRDRIHHLDYLERPALAALYRNADALLFPSWMEGFGLPLLESMACGTPVITSGISAMPEVGGPAAVYVDPASAHGIASAVAALLDDSEHRDRLINLGRERAKRFSWDLTAAATAEVLRQAAGLPATDDDEYRA